MRDGTVAGETTILLDELSLGERKGVLPSSLRLRLFLKIRWVERMIQASLNNDSYQSSKWVWKCLSDDGRTASRKIPQIKIQKCGLTSQQMLNTDKKQKQSSAAASTMSTAEVTKRVEEHKSEGNRHFQKVNAEQEWLEWSSSPAQILSNHSPLTTHTRHVVTTTLPHGYSRYSRWNMETHYMRVVKLGASHHSVLEGNRRMGGWCRSKLESYHLVESSGLLSESGRTWKVHPRLYKSTWGSEGWHHSV